MKPSYFLICLVSLSAVGCAGMGNVLAGAASGGATPQCPNRPMTVTQIGCLDGVCSAYTVPAPHVYGCP
jgi:hypothetical protein